MRAGFQARGYDTGPPLFVPTLLPFFRNGSLLRRLRLTSASSSMLACLSCWHAARSGAISIDGMSCGGRFLARVYFVQAGGPFDCSCLALVAPDPTDLATRSRRDISVRMLVVQDGCPCEQASVGWSAIVASQDRQGSHFCRRTPRQ